MHARLESNTAMASGLPEQLEKPLTFVSNCASVKPVLMARQTLGTTGTGSQTHLTPGRFDTEVSVF